MAGYGPAIHVLMSATAAGRVPIRCGGKRPGSLRRQFLRLGDPAVDAAGKPNFFAEIVSGFRVELGELRIVEDTEIVQLLFNRWRDAGQLLEIIRTATRPGQLLEAKITGCRCRRYRLGNDRLLGRADINAHLTLSTGNSVDCSLRHEIAVERHRATCIVIAWHHVSDAGRIAIGVDDGGDR